MTVPSAKGTLAATPLAHALVYARNHRLTGTFDLATEDGRRGTLTLWRGRITDVKTAPPTAYFGTVAYELGLIDSATLDATLLELSKTKKLHGEILIARGSITREQRDDVLVEQFCRKVHFLFTFPSEAAYAFYDARPGADEPAIQVDPLAPIWRGIRDYPPERFVSDVLKRIGSSTLRMVNESALDRARLPLEEAALCETLAEQPMTIRQMEIASTLPRARVSLLAYLLVISKSVEAVTGERVHPSIGALPAASPSATFRTTPSVPGMAAARSPMPTPNMPFVPRAPSSSQRLPAVPRSPSSSQRLPAVPRSPSSSQRMPAATASSGLQPRVTAPPPIATPSELGPEGIMRRANRIESEGYFEALGVAESATAEAVRAAYMRLLKSWHPDRLPPELAVLRGEVIKIFSHMTRAQQTLCDEDARRGYLSTHTTKGKKKKPRPEIIKAVELALSRRDFEAAIEESLLLDDEAEDPEAIAIRAWASAWGGEASEEELKAAVLKLDRAVHSDNSCERAFFYRGKLAKRLGNDANAFRDFARALALEPKNIDAEREVRVYEMRARKAR